MTRDKALKLLRLTAPFSLAELDNALKTRLNSIHPDFQADLKTAHGLLEAEVKQASASLSSSTQDPGYRLPPPPRSMPVSTEAKSVLFQNKGVMAAVVFFMILGVYFISGEDFSIRSAPEVKKLAQKAQPKKQAIVKKVPKTKPVVLPKLYEWDFKYFRALKPFDLPMYNPSKNPSKGPVYGHYGDILGPSHIQITRFKKTNPKIPLIIDAKHKKLTAEYCAFLSRTDQLPSQASYSPYSHMIPGRTWNFYDMDKIFLETRSAISLNCLKPK